MSDKLESIYKKIALAKEELEKARQKMSDEFDPNEDPYADEVEDDRTDREFDPDEEDSDGADWLKDNDPSYNKGEDYEEYNDDEDQDAHQKGISEDIGDVESDSQMADGTTDEESRRQEGSSNKELSTQKQKETNKPQEVKRSGRFQQPSREDLMAMRNYTRPWEQRSREAAALKADPSKNPELARHGNIVEARNAAHADRNTAYRNLTASDEYKNADPVTQMEMEDNFEKYILEATKK